ncbi:hypothetical protein FSP39_005646 [Pinctada imbricata]|uniref:CS domain-containing protein n=1 Tax=Pinctada imbricata TaxID=66713 RepID=A0AA89C4W5_PINIB|nr:hypothetical protein FSP39_005646 [Pinctada imbricata]
MANFDERSGYIPCATEWGQWWQTIEEVYIEIDVPVGTTGKEIKCEIKPKHIKVQIKDQFVLQVYIYIFLSLKCLA